MVILILKGYVAIINNTAVVQLLLFIERASVYFFSTISTKE